MLTVDRRRRVDWARIIANLMKTGMTRQEIADAVGCSIGSVKGYLYSDLETEPALWLGIKLLKLWSSRTGISWTDAPLRTVTVSAFRASRTTAFNEKQLSLWDVWKPELRAGQDVGPQPEPE